jgi:hypothetical protein
MDETDVFFNLRLGEYVLGSGRVPTENLFSFTHPHATDINLAWLFQIVLALAHRAAGLPGTVLLKTASCWARGRCSFAWPSGVGPPRWRRPR